MATTVIEVGIDIQNATVMVIEDADRFGLSQLHQLRGRAGRSGYVSHCFLIASPTTPEGEERLAAMVETTDGFRLAEEDLRIRGQGTVFGARQAGMADLRIADILRDMESLIARVVRRLRWWLPTPDWPTIVNSLTRPMHSSVVPRSGCSSHEDHRRQRSRSKAQGPAGSRYPADDGSGEGGCVLGAGRDGEGCSGARPLCRIGSTRAGGTQPGCGGGNLCRMGSGSPIDPRRQPEERRPRGEVVAAKVEEYLERPWSPR